MLLRKIDIYSYVERAEGEGDRPRGHLDLPCVLIHLGPFSENMELFVLSSLALALVPVSPAFLPSSMYCCVRGPRVLDAHWFGKKIPFVLPDFSTVRFPSTHAA